MCILVIFANGVEGSSFRTGVFQKNKPLMRGLSGARRIGTEVVVRLFFLVITSGRRGFLFALFGLFPGPSCPHLCRYLIPSLYLLGNFYIVAFYHLAPGVYGISF
ncbi:hypothetical protein QBC44DRAFT_36237 [Cladorrhinum sp. PSN332]|nr:hypothetical protein QBC44DRAFT_36237 [Cladorrhinum sp. PSN332]